MNIYLLALMTAAATTAGNFIYQYFRNKDWEKAKERSYFMGIGIGIFLLNVVFLHAKL